jgi:hypothetical protein
MKKWLDLSGERFGMLVAFWPSGRRGWRRKDGTRPTRIVWLCACDCGKLTLVESADLKRKRVISCGCHKQNPNTCIHTLFLQYKQKAKSRGLAWQLSFEKFRDLILSPCFYTGRLPSQLCQTKNKHLHRKLLYNGIDRVDNLQGYTEENCVSCWGPVNKMKLTMEQNEFITICHEVAKRHPQ